MLRRGLVLRTFAERKATNRMNSQPRSERPRRPKTSSSKHTNVYAADRSARIEMMSNTTNSRLEESDAATVRSSSPTGQPLSLRGKLLRLLFGLTFGLLLSELGIYVYFGHLVWLPLAAPPKYDTDQTSIRLAVLGGSTSKGVPYNGALRSAGFDRDFTLLGTTQLLLELRYGYTNVETDMYAEGGWPIENAVKCYWETAEFRPDVMVLYSGHNELASYYSSNMVPPYEALSPLSRTNTGQLLLRDLYRRQASAEDLEYRGKFFTENTLPSYEAEFNKERYRNYVLRLIKHCRSEGIFLIVVIPEGNYLYPPTRSVYHGPSQRQEECLKRFKQAFYLKYYKQDDAGARAILEELTEICSFADLSFELGEILYRQGNIEKATKYLGQARELDEFPPVIKSEYRQLLLDLARRYDVPTIDMRELITDRLGVPLPDHSCFVDNCHFRLPLYEVLAGEIIRVLREGPFGKLDLPGKDLTILARERDEYLGLTEEQILYCWARAHNWVAEEASETFLRLPRLESSQRFLREIQAAPPPPSVTKFVNEKIAWVEKEIESERARVLNWIREDNELWEE